MIVILKTACGCEKTIDFPDVRAPRDIRVPARFNDRCFARTFTLRGQDYKSGHLEYIEVAQ